MSTCHCYARLADARGIALIAALTVAGCASPQGIDTRTPPPPAATAISSPLSTLLEFAASVADMSLSDQRALIQRYASIPDENATTEDSLRLALLYLSAPGRSADIDVAESLLDRVARNEQGGRDLATVARLLTDALRARPREIQVVPAPPPQRREDRDGEIDALRGALENERARRARLEAQLEALLELELELELDADARPATEPPR